MAPFPENFLMPASVPDFAGHARELVALLGPRYFGIMRASKEACIVKFSYPWAVGVVGIMAFVSSAALAQSGVAVRLPDNLVPAPDGYVSVATHYVAAMPTALYISPFVWAGKVQGGAHLDAGQTVDVIARAKNYDWLLVGRNGMPLGYVPLAMLKPAN
jgi:hypothetical protein